MLDRDLAGSVRSGLLSPAQQGGVTIGILKGSKRLILTYGAARPDGVYEIGSIRKTLTGLILAQMVEQCQVSLQMPVRDLLPPGTLAEPSSGRELTLLDLSSQHSGLPRMPANFHLADPENPYADYTPKLLYAWFGEQGAAVPPGAPFVYSNVGMGLLGQALADKAGKSYGELLHDGVTGPLGMSDTVVAMLPTLQARFVQGHTADHRPAHSWDFDALAGAGGIRSTAGDMLTYLAAQLHPEQLATTGSAASQGRTLPAAIKASHTLHGEALPGTHIGVNWFSNDSGTGFWHNGATGGFSSYAQFNPSEDYALVVLCNTALNGFTDSLGLHISQRLEGRPAISMEDR